MASRRNARAQAGKVNIRKVLKDETLKRLMSFLWKNAKGTIVLSILSIIVASAASTVNAIFIQQLIASVIKPALDVGDITGELLAKLVGIIAGVASIFALAVLATILYSQLIAVAGQRILNKIRKTMFAKMESLPIRYFDSNAHGDIMSRYTNDVDTIRQFITQSLVQLLHTILTLLFVVGAMLYYSLYLALVVFVGATAMLFATRKIGGASARYFSQQQEATGKAEGYIEEGMNGLKVVKVFTHEEKSKEEFDKVNDKLCEVSTKANIYGNIIMPVLGNIGNIMYAFIAIVGSLLAMLQVPNFGFELLSHLEQAEGGWRWAGGSWPLLDVSIVVAFLTMAKSFSQSISQVSQQVAMVALALAGTKRVFDLIDEKPEVDDGYVTMVNAVKKEDGTLIETNERTHVWAWKHPHHDGTTELKELRGDIQLHDVNFGYDPGKLVLHHIDIYAHPGQRIALVGATGAGKTTITNLINRFYDIQDGKVRYDGININKIKKGYLRRSLAVVLQETTLFSGTVMENIRYGRLSATDEEVYEAARIANAYDFIMRMPHGFDTVLTTNGKNLSEGQRQLIAIARAAIKDAPVMILDEATSSIDTRTEQLVQKGWDQLMKGRTVFVIAHRLSTIQNCDAIMVLDHGRIIERGTHEQLIAQKGVYYQLYTGRFELE